MPLMNFIEANRIKTHCCKGHEFTPENTYLFEGSRHCRECRRIDARKRSKQKQARRAANPQKLKFDRLRWRLKKFYRLSVEDYFKMLETQKCRCASCGDDYSNDTRKLYIDHNHKTGQVRALLCHKCNSSFGMLKEDAQRMVDLIHYKFRTDNPGVQIPDIAAAKRLVQIYTPPCPSAH